MNSRLLDSGFLYAFINDKESRHAEVSRIFAATREPVILPVPAITEVAYLILRDLGVEALAEFLDELAETDFILETPVSEDYKRASEIIRKYDDANIDFVDAVIVAIAERLDITKILTIDRRHFGMFKQRHCAAFEIAP